MRFFNPRPANPVRLQALIIWSYLAYRARFDKSASTTTISKIFGMNRQRVKKDLDTLAGYSMATRLSTKRWMALPPPKEWYYWRTGDTWHNQICYVSLKRFPGLTRNQSILMSWLIHFHRMKRTQQSIKGLAKLTRLSVPTIRSSLAALAPGGMNYIISDVSKSSPGFQYSIPVMPEAMKFYTAPTKAQPTQDFDEVMILCNELQVDDTTRDSWIRNAKSLHIGGEQLAQAIKSYYTPFDSLWSSNVFGWIHNPAIRTRPLRKGKYVS